MKLKCYYLLLTVLVFVSCERETKQLKLQVENCLKSLYELGTVEYVVSKIVKADDKATWYKFGDRKILFSCKASLKAGIDLSKLSRDSIIINPEKKFISLILPKAELLSFNMKPDDIQLVYEKTALTRFSFSNADRDMIVAQGEKDIKESLSELGILIEAENNAKRFLETFLSRTGFSTIVIRFQN
jgi:hypothetical protein